MSNNEEILHLIKRRLDVGAKEYGQQVPLDGTRDHVQDALEEILDCTVYIACKLLEIQQHTKKKEINNEKTINR